MNDMTMKHFSRLFLAYPDLEVCRESIEEAYRMIKQSYKSSGKLLVCGNGGSAADAEHIVGELMKGFLLKRRIDDKTIAKIKEYYPKKWKYLSDDLQGALPAISLVNQISLSTAFSNDVAPDMVFAQQVYGYGKKEDVLLGLSTSGNSKNILNAVMIAKTLGMKTIGLTGENKGELKSLCDAAICVPAEETYIIQELHLPIYHCLCAMLESEFF